MSAVNAGTITGTVVTATDSIQLPLFATGSLPANTKGKLAYDSTTDQVKVNDGSAWQAMGGGVVRQIKYKISNDTAHT